MYSNGAFDGIAAFCPPVTAVPSEINDSSQVGTTTPDTISEMAAGFFAKANRDSNCKFEGLCVSLRSIMTCFTVIGTKQFQPVTSYE